MKTQQNDVSVTGNINNIGLELEKRFAQNDYNLLLQQTVADMVYKQQQSVNKN